ncbi:MAG: hypothetical protein ABSF22_14275 [Bryobacteraceae bacterium]
MSAYQWFLPENAVLTRFPHFHSSFQIATNSDSPWPVATGRQSLPHRALPVVVLNPVTAEEAVLPLNLFEFSFGCMAVSDLPRELVPQKSYRQDSPYVRLLNDSCVSGSLRDWIEQEARTSERRKFAHLSDAAVVSNYEFYRIACGLHEGRLPRPETMQNFWAVWCELRLREESKENSTFKCGA